MIGKYDITSAAARQVLDSRGNPTVECEVKTGKGFGRASVPSGASTGKHEALELRDGGKAFNGKAVTKAVANANLLGQKIIGMDARDQNGVDRLIKDTDGTKNKGNLGANACLAVSIAVCKAAANAKESGVYEHIGAVYSHENPNYVVPVPFFNVLNAGAHAGSKLELQEFLIVPKADTFADALRIGTETYHALKEVVKKKYGPIGTNVGDEGGFAPPLKTADEALKLLASAAKKAGHSDSIAFALDCAASNFYKKGKYVLDKKRLSADKLADYYVSLVKKHKIVSIEDPFHEDDFDAFAELTKRLPKTQIVGDDLFVTRESRLKQGIRMRAGNAMILKPNQVGTLTEAFLAAQFARHSDFGVMVSHRSGDTCDPFIADLAVGMGCKQIKSGAPCRGERLAKYNQLLRIEGQGIEYAKWFK